MSNLAERTAVKVPEITLVFWLIKIAATTLGETAGDAVSMSMNLGYLAATGVFATIMVVAVNAQVRAPRFSPFHYWATIIATTTLGTTLADFADRSLGIGYLGGSVLLAFVGEYIEDRTQRLCPQAVGGAVPPEHAPIAHVEQARRVAPRRLEPGGGRAAIGPGALRTVAARAGMRAARR